MILQTSDKKSIIVQKVLVRRGETSLGEWLTRSLVDGIRDGKLERTDEFSGDGRHWAVLSEHHQLKQYFPELPTSQEPPGFCQQLSEMADLLEDLQKN
ncbi:MAG: hypothetical protein G3M70_00095 [Candidatus Nitronauta litoralis]|uniref:Uncharacterized protein n=1 Tax=Candidatus Nitronauta litoralis TaxID=2705533 RepID=A0A7T0FZ21_9BACT|nr:MAG: hypothetical protein G3M70_00095 [Candidatus Nitronauta litoralis]